MPGTVGTGEASTGASGVDGTMILLNNGGMKAHGLTIVEEFAGGGAETTARPTMSERCHHPSRKTGVPTKRAYVCPWRGRRQRGVCMGDKPGGGPRQRPGSNA
jgi:hypothetical protein